MNGKILFDEYIDGTKDFHIWRDASPAKNGTKIIDRPNKKAYYYEERMAFQDIETRKYSNWINILRDNQVYLILRLKENIRTNIDLRLILINLMRHSKMQAFFTI